MHCYEVIPEGAVCKLYFDLEFHKPSNREADGKKMVAMLIQYVCQKLKDVYGVECCATSILSLDSSTEDKFSRHLIFNLPNAAFKDNIHVGAFIHAILQPVLDGCNEEGHHNFIYSSRTQNQETDHSFLHVKNKDGHPALFVDLGVYTKNRNFRLYKSSKVGKNAAFSLADDNKFISKLSKGVSPEESVFLASLVCNVSFTGQRILTWEGADARACRTTRVQRQMCLPSDSGLLSSCLTSPHREVDDFVLTVVRRDAVQGSIRRWNYFAAQQLLVYDIAKYRWCDNVGRFHKSNNIMIVVDLKEEVWYQKCHDPECRNFRSSSYPLPQEMCISYIMMQDEEDQAFVMDEEGNIEPSQAPKEAAQDQESKVVWRGDAEDDREFSDCLDDFEMTSSEISDELLLSCV
ncbi:DNA-directed primase/polymerase protein isoform X1 [Hippocampus comes]|uniref:DNA-directed primase/polymerase protein isoform X1 n=1 Tax=Hippocampus comes TaxID=109280 RepID=UPI00094EC04D|nr:PREDICTED: DNA-directed primase/polymerase protein isoform X1 [Hippocampus comes]